MSTSVCVCLSVWTRGYLRNHTRDLYQIFVVDVAYGRGSVLLRQGNEIPTGRGNVVVFPHFSSLYRNAFGTHIRTTQPIEMTFGVMSGLCYVFLRFFATLLCVLRGLTIPEGEWAIWEENTYPASLTPLITANWTGPCIGTRQGQTLDCKRWKSLLLAPKWGWDWIPRAKSDLYDCRVYSLV